MTKALVILGTILKFVCFVDMPTGEVWGIGAQIIILDHVMKVFFLSRVSGLQPESLFIVLKNIYNITVGKLRNGQHNHE